MRVQSTRFALPSCSCNPPIFQEGEVNPVSRILISIKYLVCFGFHTLQHGFLCWTRPLKTSLLLGTLADLARGKSELVAENALLRQQLIILRRQSKRPVCTKRDRSLLVLLARATRSWRQALLIVQPDDPFAMASSGLSSVLEAQVESDFEYTKGDGRDHCIDQRDGNEQPALGAERIRGELLKLDIHVCKRTIQKYMRGVRTPRPTGQSWRTFLRNHGERSGPAISSK